MSPTFPTTSPPNSMNILTSHEYDILLNPPYTLSVSLDSLIKPKRGRNRNHCSKPPRPSNSWILFRTNFTSRLRSQYPENSYSIVDISRMAGKDWESQPTTVKQYFCALSKLADKRHKETYSDYTFRPEKSKRNKRKNLLFKEVDKAKLIQDGNNATKMTRDNIQLDNSVQLNADNAVEQGSVQQNENENKHFQLSPDEYVSLSRFVHEQPNEFEELSVSDEYTLLVDSVPLTNHIEYDRLHEYTHVELSTLLGTFLHEHGQFVAYGQYAPSNELVSHIDEQYDSLINESLFTNGFGIPGNERYDVQPSHDVISAATDVNHMFCSNDMLNRPL
ncbi:3510_t:CDS:1 [Paraglomus occultum]|uniref:3510_t:CDS:1 n=1 Tax=Paraglomus occultum TaxID=144539 RepID=A0A9N9GC67_9GLOM|nr:3510_t:CDS:1 [Paraglomus occultum]